MIQKNVYDFYYDLPSNIISRRKNCNIAFTSYNIEYKCHVIYYVRKMITFIVIVSNKTNHINILPFNPKC